MILTDNQGSYQFPSFTALTWNSLCQLLEVIRPHCSDSPRVHHLTVFLKKKCFCILTQIVLETRKCAQHLLQPLVPLTNAARMRMIPKFNVSCSISWWSKNTFFQQNWSFTKFQKIIGPHIPFYGCRYTATRDVPGWNITPGATIWHKCGQLLK